MKQLLVAGAALFALTAVAQTSAPQATTTENQTSTTAESTVQPVRKLTPGLIVLGERSFVDPTDRQATDLDMTFHFKLAYKFDSGNKLTFNEKYYYSHAVIPEKQYLMTAFSTLRMDYSIPNSIGTGSATVVRLAVPVAQADLDSNYLGSLVVMPNLNWELTPKLSLAYSGYAGITAYSGLRKNTPAWLQDQKLDGKPQDEVDSYMALTGAERSFLYVINTASLSINFTDKLSLTQSLGYSFGLKNLSDNMAKFKKKTGAYEIGTELGIQATKNVSITVGVSQQAADMAGAADLSTNKGIFFDGNNFALYRDEQTTYSVNTSINF